MGVLPFIFKWVTLLVATGGEDINGVETAIGDAAAVGDGTAGISIALPVACVFVGEVTAGVDEAWRWHVDEGAVAGITST